jgi:F-type H+-transporting ATPase subunit alpha
MKQVAGTVKLDLAQFRELQAFSQFGSDLDASTKKLIDRGQRITELLKQDQYSTLQMEEEVAVLYAGVNGYIDNLEVKQLKEFEQSLLRILRGKEKKILDSIRKEQKIIEDTEKKLKSVLDKLIGEMTNKAAV